MGFVKAYCATLDKHAVLAESALPHMPFWVPVDREDVRPNPWDFEEPEVDEHVAAKPAKKVAPTKVAPAKAVTDSGEKKSADTTKGVTDNG